ncbi:FecR domain-containing protein [Sphingomonas oligophenolica]|uniref:FecR domain-containing protein n=1 Tax=Sphingomonas oligophenolica TaxID=301154 RepID=A0ABU9Y1B4_9SPHN
MSRAEQASDRAAQWIIAQEDGDWDANDQASFEAWLAEADGNKAAYWRLKYSWKEADRIGALGGKQRGPANDRGYRWGRPGWLPAAIAASIVVLIGIAYTAWQPIFRPNPSSVAAAYATPIGGRKMVDFSDGSHVQLNTATSVRATVTARKREVWVDKGEAFFEVAHLNGLPFVVHAGDRQVTVLGTKFSVRREGDAVTVAVLEGRVRVDQVADNHTVRSAVIVGGDIALARGPATLVTTRSEESVESTLAWRSGMLDFDQTSLSDAAAEFNRYNVRKMVITDPEAAAIRIGGTFPASDPDAFVRLLRNAYGLKVEETASTVKISG